MRGRTLVAQMENDLRRRLGARLLTERIQVKDWNELTAAKAAGIQPKTIRRIERGLNYEIESVEKYAQALGQSLEYWLRDVLREEFAQAPAVGGGTFRGPERRTVNLGHGPTGEQRRATDARNDRMASKTGS